MSKKIFLVNDDTDFLIMAKALLKNHGYKIVTAKNNDECLKNVGRYKPDIVFIPVISKGTLPKDISSKLKGIKVIYLTRGRLTELERHELIAKKGNPVDVVYYPVDPKRLLYILRKHLGENGD